MIGNGHKAGVRRVSGGDGVRFGYRAADEIRRSPNVIPAGGSEDFHLRRDRDVLVRQSRALARDNGLFQGIHRVAIDNILGGGFALQATTANARTNERLEALFAEWSESPEIRGMDFWDQVEQFALSDMMIAGDVGAILLDDGKIQIIEAERIDHGRTQTKTGGNRMESGIELDRYGRPLRYYVKNYDTRSSQTSGRARPIDAESFVFAAHRRRSSQTRGVPALLATFADINRLDDILSSEAASWQILSRLAVSRKQDEGPTLAAQNTTTQDNYTPSDEDLAQTVTDVGMALIFNCKPGESIEGIQHNIPGPNFESSVRVYLRLLGLPLGLPLELIILDWSQSNYSSARAALEQAFLNFRRWQLRLQRNWHTPIYRWLVRRWIDEGTIAERPDVMRHAWIAPEFPWLDQLKEAQAWGMKLDRGLALHAEALKSVRRDRDEYLQMRTREIEGAHEIAAEIAAKFPSADAAAIAAHLCGMSLRTPNTAKKGEQTPTSERPGEGDGPDDDDGQDGTE